MDEFEVWWDL